MTLDKAPHEFMSHAMPLLGITAVDSNGLCFVRNVMKFGL
jgi:hypothetical protein